MENEFKDKIILVTGGTGTIGSELVKQLLAFEPKQVRVLSRDESKQYYLQEALNYPKNLRLLIGDIRDKERLNLAFKDVDIVFHAAALKHVPFCEYNPYEAVKTNIIGSQNIINAAVERQVKKVIAISTDKAAGPVNVMGTTKLMMEKLFVNANYVMGKMETQFACVRFGNVAWSNGSVLPVWKKQAEKDKVIRITNHEMTRFFMSIKQAAGLVLKAAQYSRGGEIFVLKMPSIKLIDLAKMFVEKFFPNEEIGIMLVGDRAGEKMHEDLFDASQENGAVFEDGKMFIVVPKMNIYNRAEREVADYQGFSHLDKNQPARYSSADFIDIEQMRGIV